MKKYAMKLFCFQNFSMPRLITPAHDETEFRVKKRIWLDFQVSHPQQS
jgi:hypothetical protein